VSGETEQTPSAWTIDSLHEHLVGRLEDLRVLLDERHAAQQLAMSTALTAAEKAVAAALVSAEKAVSKAEAASEKRFDSVNEFRQQLSDQAATFAARAEVEVQIKALSEKVESETARNRERISALELAYRSTVASEDGRDAGKVAADLNRRALATQLTAGLSLLVFVLSIVASVVIALQR
jgi:cysteinyl-tRNA synthetase